MAKPTRDIGLVIFAAGILAVLLSFVGTGIGLILLKPFQAIGIGMVTGVVTFILGVIIIRFD